MLLIAMYKSDNSMTSLICREDEEEENKSNLHILIGRQKLSSVLDVHSFRAAECDH
jgi:hypothetical protein